MKLITAIIDRSRSTTKTGAGVLGMTVITDGGSHGGLPRGEYSVVRTEGSRLTIPLSTRS